MPTTYQGNVIECNNLCFPQLKELEDRITHRKRPLFILNRILNNRTLLSMLTCFLPTTLIPSTFSAFCILRTSPKNIIKQLSMNEERRIINELVQEERALLRNERKRPWNIRTRRPFRGAIDRVKPTFREKIELATKVVEKLGLPVLYKKRKSNRGRKNIYDLWKVIPAIMVKGTLSFVDLSNELKNIKYDATLDGSGRTPQKTYLSDVFQIIPTDYLQKAMKIYDHMINELYSKFDEKMDTFVGDNSAITCETLSKQTRAMETILVRDIQPFFALVRVETNGFRFIGKSINKIRDIMQHLPPHSKLLLDGEFDVDKNYQLGIENEIDLHINQKNTNRVRSSSRKKGKRIFDVKKYRKRKLGERVFGNIEKRRVKCYYQTKESRLKGCILLGIEHNAIEWYKAKAWCDMFFELK